MAGIEEILKQIVQKAIIPLVRTNHEARMRLAASYVPDRSKVCDIGCNGFPNKYLLGEVYGLDVEFGEKGKFHNYTKLITANAEEGLPIGDESFDAVVALEIIEHLVAPLRFFDEVIRICKPGGTIILSTPNPYYWITVAANWFFPKGTSESGVSGGSYESRNVTTGKYKGHISLLSPRVINLMAFERGLVPVALREFTGSWRVPWSYGLLYVFRKSK